MDFSAAIRLLNDSVDSVWRNLGTALRVSFLPFAVFLAILGLVFSREIILLVTGVEKHLNLHIGLFRVLVIVLSGSFLFYLSAVLWHRAILPTRGESAFPLGETLAYLFKSAFAMVAIALLIFVICLVPLMMIGGGRISVGDFANGYRQGWGHFILTFFATWAFWVAYVALSPSMVHSAISGREGVFAPLWRSRGKGPVIRATAMVITLCLLANSVIGLGIGGIPAIAQIVVHIAILWFVFMVSISLMTQFYALSEHSGAPEPQQDGGS